MSTSLATVAPRATVRGLFANLARKHLSAKHKRLIFLSSLYGLMQEVRDPDLAILRELNEVLKIAQHAEAYTVPIWVKSFIWRDKDVLVFQSEGRTFSLSELTGGRLEMGEIMIAADQIVRNAPGWLSYDTMTQMRLDVVKLVRQVRRQSSLAMA